MNTELIPQEAIQSKILFLRGKRVMLDRDLAILYEVPTKALNQAVKRNIHRFPDHFMFQLTSEEKDELVTNCDRFKTLKHSTTLPYAFTEHGVAMLSSVLNSEKAIMVNIQIINAFIRMRELLMNYAEIKQKIEDMEQKYDYQFKVVFDAMSKLLEPPEKPEKKIGFQN
jgi:hypothetical protein